MYYLSAELRRLTYADEAHEREQMALKTEGQAPPPATFYELERLITRMSVPPLPVRTFSGMCGDLEMMDCISIWVVEEL